MQLVEYRIATKHLDHYIDRLKEEDYPSIEQKPYGPYYTILIISVPNIRVIHLSRLLLYIDHHLNE